MIIDLHGMMRDDALVLARDRIVDQYTKNASGIEIIHGKGDGILRSGIIEIVDDLRTRHHYKIGYDKGLHLQTGSTKLIFGEIL